MDHGVLCYAVSRDHPQILVTKHNETLFLSHILGSLRAWFHLYPPRCRLIEPHLGIHQPPWQGENVVNRALAMKRLAVTLCTNLPTQITVVKPSHNLLTGTGFFLWQWYKSIKVSDVSCITENTKILWTVHYKRVNFMIWELHLNKIIIKRVETRAQKKC